MPDLLPVDLALLPSEQRRRAKPRRQRAVEPSPTSEFPDISILAR